jgi:hypothetical protein
MKAAADVTAPHNIMVSEVRARRAQLERVHGELLEAINATGTTDNLHGELVRTQRAMAEAQLAHLRFLQVAGSA